MLKLRNTGELSSRPREKTDTPSARSSHFAGTAQGAVPPRACGGRARSGPEGAESAGEGGALGAGSFLFRRQEEPRAAGAAAAGAATAAAAATVGLCSVLQCPVPLDPSPLLDLAAGSGLAG